MRNLEINLEITHDVDGNIKTIENVLCDVNGHVEATNTLIQEVAHSVNDSVKATKRRFLFIFMQALALFSVITLPYRIYAASVSRK